MFLDRQIKTDKKTQTFIPLGRRTAKDNLIQQENVIFQVDLFPKMLGAHVCLLVV